MLFFRLTKILYSIFFDYNNDNIFFISGSPIAYYPYLGKTFASPYYSQYQPTVPYNGVYPQFYPYSYSVSPYSASPYSSPVSASAYPGYFGYNQGYNQGYVPQYYSGYPSYQTSGEIQSVSKQ